MKLNATVVLVGAIVLGLLAYRSLTRQPQPPVASAINCAPAEIRKVTAAIERAILSAQCERRAAAKPASASASASATASASAAAAVTAPAPTPPPPALRPY